MNTKIYVGEVTGEAVTHTIGHSEGDSIRVIITDINDLVVDSTFEIVCPTAVAVTFIPVNGSEYTCNVDPT